MTESVSSAIKNWIPYRLFEEKGMAGCRWLYLQDKEFIEPFFDETILKCMAFADNSRSTKCVSSLDILPEWAGKIESVAPTMIIFHVSRCGSTLLSQLFGLKPSNIVLSEVPFFDELMRWSYSKNATKDILPLLKAAIELYSAKRSATDQHLIIKTDSWHIHFYELFRRLYPHVPFVFLYRRPDEVIHSQQMKRGMQSIPGLIEPGIFGFVQSDIQQLSLDEYMARVIESYFRKFIEILTTDRNVLAVNYDEGVATMVKKVADFAGIIISEEELLVMQKRSSFHGKYPKQIFEEAAIIQRMPGNLDTAFENYLEIEKVRLG